MKKAKTTTDELTRLETCTRSASECKCNSHTRYVRATFGLRLRKMYECLRARSSHVHSEADFKGAMC